MPQNQIKSNQIICPKISTKMGVWLDSEGYQTLAAEIRYPAKLIGLKKKNWTWWSQNYFFLTDKILKFKFISF